MSTIEKLKEQKEGTRKNLSRIQDHLAKDQRMVINTVVGRMEVRPESVNGSGEYFRVMWKDHNELATIKVEDHSYWKIEEVKAGAPRYSVSLRTSSQNCESDDEFFRAIMLGQLAEEVQNAKKEIVEKFSELYEKYNPQILDHYRRITEFDIEITKIEKEVQRVEREQFKTDLLQGINFIIEGEGGMKFRNLPSIEVRYNDFWNNVKYLKVREYSASGKTCSIEAVQVYSNHNGDLDEYKRAIGRVQVANLLNLATKFKFTVNENIDK